MKTLIQTIIPDSNKLVLQACVPFTELQKKALFTFRKQTEGDPYDPYGSEENQLYQRELNLPHLDKIERYLRKSILQMGTKPTAIFPTSMLIAFSTDETFAVADLSQTDVEVELPERCYIVDGQHRLKAMINLMDNCMYRESDECKTIVAYLSHYSFNCTLLLNFDLWEQAKIFADVNFTQKKVSKSLYYDIYGTFAPDENSDLRQNSIFLAHSLVEYLNNYEHSPLHKQIRMLGNGRGVISQSFLVEALLRHISSPRAIWYQSTFAVEHLRLMKIELLSYLSVVKQVFDTCWENDEYIIRKTTSIGALMRLMGYLHNKLDAKTLSALQIDYSKIFICEEYCNAITPCVKALKPHEETLFSKKGEYAKTGGQGLELKLYNKMRELVQPTLQ